MSENKANMILDAWANTRHRAEEGVLMETWA